MGYCIEHLPSRLSIGRETENGVTDIRIDCTDWLERWPGMTVAAIFCPPGGTPYILDTEMNGNSLVWHVRETDTATPGVGQLELTGEADGKRKLSALVDVQVARRLPGTAGDAPDPAQPWVDSVLGAAERITGMQVAAETLQAGSNATAQWNGEAGLLTLGIPRGPVGPQGEKGDTGGVGPAGSDGITPAISVGTVTTLEAGSQATVARRGTDDAPIFDFGIPRGEDGWTGGEIPKPLTYDYMPEGYPTKKVSIVTLLEEQDLQFNESEGVYFSNLPKIIDFQEGQTYKIVFDGTEYNCVCAIDENVGLYIGNIGIFYGTGYENNEPFLATNTILATNMIGAIHRVSIEGPSIDYTLIDRKFLPIASEETSGITSLKITSNDVYKKYISTPTVEMGSNTFLRDYLNKNRGKVTIGFHKDNKTVGFSLDRSTAGGNVDLILAYAYKQTIVGYHVGDTGAEKTFELEKDGLTITSSTVGSTKRFKITVDDSGTLSATEVTN